MDFMTLTECYAQGKCAVKVERRGNAGNQFIFQQCHIFYCTYLASNTECKMYKAFLTLLGK